MGSHLFGALSSLQSAALQLNSNAEVPLVRTPVEEVNQVGAALSKAADEALRREAHLRSILETVPSAMVVIDSRGTIRSFSATAERLFGYRADELAGSNVRILMPEPDRGAHDGYIERYFQTGERRVKGSRIVVGLKKDGTQFPVELHVGEVEVGGEKIFTGFMRDQTERRRIEQELRQTQKIEAIGKLTGGVAHDFNNLLTVINGNLEMLETKVDVKHRQLIADAQEASNLAAQLTTSLLAFGRQMPLNPVLSDLGQLVTATAHMLGRTLGETIVIRTVINTGCWTVVDAPQLQNALLNLGINARDAMPKGGTLSIEVSQDELLDPYHATVDPEVLLGRFVLITLSDTGIGMSPETMERAFEPFFTTKPYGAGTGLGLSSVYGFVKQSGGHVALHSEEGLGTTIRIYLPYASKDLNIEAPAAGQSLPPLPIGMGERILVVEDDDRVRRVAMKRLRSLGYSVLEAANGPAALDLLEKQTGVDLLFTDVVMPGMSGAELALEVRRRWPLLPVLFTSGYAEPAARSKIGIEREEWLTKPYTTANLASHLEAIFKKRQYAAGARAPDGSSSSPSDA
ncbi:PAS domain S-box protein [Rhizobium sp. RAF56]|uniref:PAS domain S-box protein n=1 Tax=Rhizobium sp. RAF56 TaxID=3233062 RepID=UPI003F9AC656